MTLVPGVATTFTVDDPGPERNLELNVCSRGEEIRGSRVRGTRFDPQTDPHELRFSWTTLDPCGA
jgi:hypothetical protein